MLTKRKVMHEVESLHFH